jgi:hypothetical protein
MNCLHLRTQSYPRVQHSRYRYGTVTGELNALAIPAYLQHPSVSRLTGKGNGELLVDYVASEELPSRLRAIGLPSEMT